MFSYNGGVENSVYRKADPEMLACNHSDRIERNGAKETDTGCLTGTGRLYDYVSADGIKVKINYTGEKTLEDALFEYFTADTLYSGDTAPGS